MKFRSDKFNYFRFLSIKLLLILSISCSSNSESPGTFDVGTGLTNAALAESLFSTRWILQEAVNARGSAVLPTGDIVDLGYTLQFLEFGEEDVYRHFIICEMLTGRYTLDEAVVNIVSTGIGIPIDCASTLTDEHIPLNTFLRNLYSEDQLLAEVRGDELFLSDINNAFVRYLREGI